MRHPWPMVATLLALSHGCSNGDTIAAVDNKSIESLHDAKIQKYLTCGREASSDKISQYIQRIRDLISSEYQIYSHSDLFFSRVYLGSYEKGLSVAREDIGKFPRELPTNEDWDKILRSLGEGNLKSAGWRGCFLSHGKIAFNADADGNLGISAFDAGRAWATP